MQQVPGAQTHHRRELSAWKAIHMQTMPGGIEMQIFCSWPVRCLSPNSRSHWAIKARARRDQKAEAYLLACRAFPPDVRAKLRDMDRLTVKLQFVRPNRAPRDIDNMLASFKGALDGLAQAIGTNDNKFRLEIDMDEPPMRPGGVRIIVKTGVASAQASP